MSLWTRWQRWRNPPRCKTCHRRLKNALAVERGYGSVCWSKIPRIDAALSRISAAYCQPDFVSDRFFRKNP